MPYLTHFWRLSTDRPAGFGGVLPIPWSSISRYAEQYGFASEVDYDSFVAIISRLDNAYLEIKNPPPEKPKGAASGV